MKTCIKVIVLMAVATFACYPSTITLDLGYSFTPGGQPAGAPPWLTATFTDVVGGVELEMTSNLTSDSEFVTEWYFNLDPALDRTQLDFTYLAAQSTVEPTYQVGNVKADGDGYYDIRFNFPEAGNQRFMEGDVTTFLISGITGLSANDFKFLSDPGGGNGVYLSAAHVQGIRGGAVPSAWIGTSDAPEPSPALLFGTGLTLVAIGAFVRSRRRKAAASTSR